MIKISTPSNLSPFDRPAVFGIASDTPSADAGAYVEAVLEDIRSGAVLAARRMRLDDTAAAQFDAAPVLRRAMRLRPAEAATGLAAADECTFRVRLSVRDVRPADEPDEGSAVQSAAVTLVSAASGDNALQLVTTMPAHRTIRHGESDRLLFFTPTSFTAEVEVQTPSGSAVRSFAWNGGAGLVTLHLRTSDFDAAAGRITVRAGGTTVEYAVEPASPGGMRIAWRTACGSVEHYTFPVVARRTQLAAGRKIRLADGVCTAAGAGHSEAAVRSPYESCDTVSALAAIADSPQVWACGSDGGYTDVTVLTSEVVTHRFGEPSNVELTVRPSQNGVRL